jgi:3-carboxy-cis,cis-muconate cycloisomerase
MASFCDQDYLQALLDVEVALAAAAAASGLIPESSVGDIRAAATADRYEIAALEGDARSDGNIVIPLVRKLTEAVAARNPESARYVHHGATSQDIIDTAQVLRIRVESAALQKSLTAIMNACAALAREHAVTPMPGRTWLQQASPTTFGLKAAGWLDMIGRCRDRIGDVAERSRVLQLGGASGTLASLGNAGSAVAEAMAKELGLTVPAMPWHTHRDRLADVASAFGISSGALGKIGRDLTLLAQSEIGEAVESKGSGGSSSMPHKQNPVHAVTALAGAIRTPGLVATVLAAMPQEHERAAGGWQAEWPAMTELIRTTRESADAVATAIGNLRIDRSAMRRNLEVRGGVAMAEALSSALMPHVSRSDAMKHVERLCRTVDREGGSLRDTAARDPEITRWLPAAEIDRVLAPEHFLGSAKVFVERVLTLWSV